MSTQITTLMVLLTLVCESTGAKILAVMPFPSYSHQIVFQALWKELSLRGHQVTTLTSAPIKDPVLVNLTEIDLSSTRDIWSTNVRKAVVSTKKNLFESYLDIFSSEVMFVDKQLEHPQVQQLLRDKNAVFDLVIVEYMSPAMFAFAKRFDCPHIGVVSLDPPSFVYEFLGNAVHPALYPDILRPYNDKYTLLGRLNSVVYHFGVKLINYFYYMPANEALVKKHFGDGYPSLWSITENASALLVNANVVFHKTMPLAPNVVLIGGKVTWSDNTFLSQELQHTLDDSKGYIYFSLGTNAKTTDLPPNALQIFNETFSELPYTVLWKIDSKLAKNFSKNIVASEWFPQQAILKHPKIKVFITQGGQQSMEEAITSNVPMIGVPMYVDQPHNVQKMVEQGYGLSVDYFNLEKTEFKRTILEITINPKYRDTIKRLADLAHDQQTTGLERAVWWTEFVIRHKGAKHLRNRLLDVPWYQYLLLDVLAVCLLVVGVFLYVLYRLARLVKMLAVKLKQD